MSSNRRTLQILLSLTLFVVFAVALLYQFSMTATALGHDQPQLQLQVTRDGNIVGTPRDGGSGIGGCPPAGILVVGVCFLSLSQRKRAKPAHLADLGTERHDHN